MIRISVGWSLASILGTGRLAVYFADVDMIDLGVCADNTSAIGCYRSVGFEICPAYDEWRVITMLAP